MTYTHRTIIVTESQALLARSLCEQLAGPSGSGMFTTALSASGAEPATHYISAGQIDDSFAAAMSNAAILYAACQQANIKVSEVECNVLLSSSDVSAEAPFNGMVRLSLKLVERTI